MISLYVCSACLCYVTRGRSRLSNWCSFLKYDVLTLQIFWTARCENREICEYLLFFFLNQKRSIRIEEPYATFIYIASLQAYVLHNINNALCLCKQFTTILTPWFWYGKCHFVHCRYPRKARTDATVLSLFVFTV